MVEYKFINCSFSSYFKITTRAPFIDIYLYFINGSIMYTYFSNNNFLNISTTDVLGIKNY